MLKKVGKVPIKFASYPFAEINCVKVLNGVAFLHPSSPFVREGGSWSFMNAVDLLNREMSKFQGPMHPILTPLMGPLEFPVLMEQKCPSVGLKLEDIVKK